MKSTTPHCIDKNKPEKITCNRLAEKSTDKWSWWIQVKAEGLTADHHDVRSTPGINNNIPTFGTRQNCLSSSGYMDYELIGSLYSFCSFDGSICWGCLIWFVQNDNEQFKCILYFRLLTQSILQSAF